MASRPTALKVNNEGDMQRFECMLLVRWSPSPVGVLWLTRSFQASPELHCPNVTSLYSDARVPLSSDMDVADPVAYLHREGCRLCQGRMTENPRLDHSMVDAVASPPPYIQTFQMHDPFHRPLDKHRNTTGPRKCVSQHPTVLAGFNISSTLDTLRLPCAQKSAMSSLECKINVPDAEPANQSLSWRRSQIHVREFLA